MHTNVRQIRPRETAIIHSETIDMLRDSLGDGPGQHVVERAAFEISDRLAGMEEALLTGDLAAVRAKAKHLAGIGDNLGMVQFAKIARDLEFCIDSRDFVAVAAISRRLLRVGEDSVFSVVDLVNA